MTEAAAEAQADLKPLSRREFLYYLWGASMAVVLAGSGGLTIWFALPRFREGEFGGIFHIPVEDVPPPNSEPIDFPAGRFFLVNIGEEHIEDERRPGDYPLSHGVRALYKVCVHLGCLYKWVSTNDRFECPCHGSKYIPAGIRIDGPARRNLDQFIIEAVNEAGEVLTRTEPVYPPGSPQVEGSSIELPPGTVVLRIDTGRRVNGAPNTQPGGGV